MSAAGLREPRAPGDAARSPANDDAAAVETGEVLVDLAEMARVVAPGAAPANDELTAGDDEADVLLAADPEFARVCDERRAAWIESMEADAERARGPFEEEEERDDDRT